MRKKHIMMPAVVLVLTILILIGKISKASAADEKNTICKGVFIDQVDVGGMTASEAQSALDHFIEELGSKEVIVRIDGHDVKAQLGKLGFSNVASDSIHQALLIGKSGNLIKRYKQLKDIAQDKFVYLLQFKIDESKLNSFIDKDVSKYNVKPKDASVSRENGQFVYKDEKTGRMADVKQTAALITKQLSDNWNRKDITVDAVMHEEKPKFTREDVEKCDTLMGSFSTTYESSSPERAKNLANGARLINNSVVYPGEVFSAHDTLAPFTVENGYEVAGAYLNGVVVDSVGGGACQVSTTLYNAVLFAELEVVQRSPHSMTVGYVDRSRDAALAGDYKDFKFRNSTDAPILIEGFTQGRTITFKIYGHETRDTKNRRIEFESEDTGHTPPPQKPII
jgi:vancomycin resistance protein YoaR